MSADKNLAVKNRKILKDMVALKENSVEKLHVSLHF